MHETREDDTRSPRTPRDVLVVEDDVAFREVISRNLRSRGMEVREAASVRGALRELMSRQPDLLFLDINLPDQTGWDLLREARRRGMDIPTVVLSAVQATPSRLEEFKPLAYLPKPCPIEALLRLATGTLESESGAGLSEDGQKPFPPGAARPSIVRVRGNRHA